MQLRRLHYGHATHLMFRLIDSRRDRIYANEITCISNRSVYECSHKVQNISNIFGGYAVGHNVVNDTKQCENSAE